MALYEYRCLGCGPFDIRGGVAPEAACPRCGVPATRIFSAPGGRAPRRQRQLEGMGMQALRRVDRAQAGSATIGGLPAGVRLDASGKAPARPPSPGETRRPWQLGH